MSRYRSLSYLKDVRGKPCLVCGAEGSAHHLTYAQPRGLGIKSGDQFVVPVCHKHHMELHQSPMPERTWWALLGIDPMKWVKYNRSIWEKEHGDEFVSEHRSSTRRVQSKPSNHPQHGSGNDNDPKLAVGNLERPGRRWLYERKKEK